jgi:hypothetical protein
MTAFAIGKLQGGWSINQVDARIREMLAAEQWPTPAPIGSICRNFSFQLASSGLASFGFLKKSRIITIETPPTGRFI